MTAPIRVPPDQSVTDAGHRRERLVRAPPREAPCVTRVSLVEKRNVSTRR